MAPPARRAPSLRVAGFPVHVRPGFLVFMLLVVALNGDTPSFGIWLAVLMALFTLLHELGHAVAARAAGCRAEISLDFLAGYASFVPSRPLRRWERAGISVAGPLVQIVAGLATFAALGGDLTWPLHGATAGQYAALWAGPVIGIFNLLPLLPFDGGNLLLVIVEVVAPRHARRIMYAFTIGVTVAVVAVMLGRPQLQPLAIFALIPLVTVVQMMIADRDRAARAGRADTHSRAEAMAWATDDVRGFLDAEGRPGDHLPSPWFRSWQQLRAGDTVAARAVMLADLRGDHDDRWWPPDAAPVDALAAVADLVPNPAPVDRAYSVMVLCGVLLRLGRHHQAAAVAAEAHRVHGGAPFAVLVARAAAALGDRRTAVGWLAAAAREGDALAVRVAVDQAPEFATLRSDPELEHLGR